MDDYFLIDREISKSYSQHGYNNELFMHCSKYMADSRYEKVKAELRYRIWKEMRKNNEAITSLYSNHKQYEKIFDMLVGFYTRVREAVLGIEEIWVFLVEPLFNTELNGGLVFDQLHKTLFKTEIINGHRYIAAFVKEIRDSIEDVHEREA